MDFNKLLKIVEAERMLKEAAPTPEHEAMKATLTNHAARQGFTEDVANWPTGFPDVLKLDRSRQYLFLGDAKVAANEPPTRVLTVNRINGYLKAFSGLLSAKTIKGGTIAILTDEEKAARGWINTLNVLALKANISEPPSQLPNFKVQKLREGWLTFW